MKERLERAGTKTGLLILCSAVICSSCLAFSISKVPKLLVAVGLGDFTGIGCHGLCCSSPLTIAGIWGLLVVVLGLDMGGHWAAAVLGPQDAQQVSPLIGLLDSVWSVIGAG